MINNKHKSVKKKRTLYDIIRRLTAKGFNMPSVKLVSDGDIITYLKHVKL